MSTIISILPDRLEITLVKGDRAKPFSFQLLDNAGDPIMTYGASMVIAKSVGGTLVKELDETDGINISASIATVDLPTDLEARQYKQYLQVSLDGVWKFTIYSGPYTLVNPGETEGARTKITQVVCKLPVLPVSGGGGGFVLVDSSGNPILDASGNPITTNQ